MQVRLTVRWGSRLQGDIVSVSEARAKALVEGGYARYLAGVVVDSQEQVEVSESEPVETLESVKAKLDALGVSYSPRIGLEKASERLAEAMSTK